MEMVILDRYDQRCILRERRESGADRFDEVWDGVYVVSTVADNEHQYLIGELACSILQTFDRSEGVHVYAGVNVSDREVKWRRNYRWPDVAVFLPGNPAKDCGTHWFGGPDFVAEVISPNDRTRRKLPFYAKVGVRELLLVDRRPWCLELLRQRGEGWELVGQEEMGSSAALDSAVLPVTFRLVPGDPWPHLEVASKEGA